MDSVLGYGHHSGQWLAYVKRGWPAAIVLAYGERADVGTGHTTGRTDNWTDIQRDGHTTGRTDNGTDRQLDGHTTGRTG